MTEALLIAGLVVVFGLFFWRYSRESSSPSRDILLGKTFGRILDGEREEVLEEMRKLYQETHQDVGIGLALGILLRRLGKNQAAIRTHRSLTSRLNLEPDLKALILTELAADYLASGLLDRAKASLKEALSLRSNDELMTRFGERIYSRLNEWDAAFQLIQSYGKRSGKKVNAQLAMIRNEQGCFFWEQGSADAARQAFRKAASLDPQCLPAYLNLARFEREQGNTAKALKLLQRKYGFFKGQEWLALDAIRECALTLNQPQVLLGPMDEQLDAEPDDWRTMSVYATYETDLGNYRAAADWYLRALKKSPQTLLIHQRLWSILLRGDDIGDLLKTYQNQTRQDLVFSSPYECQGCHFHSSSLLWRCPSCFRQYSFRERSI